MSSSSLYTNELTTKDSDFMTDTLYTLDKSCKNI